MFKIIKKLPFGATICAIAFLFLQTGCSLYLPYITADIVNKGVVAGNTSFILQAGFIMIGLSVCSLIGAVFNTLLFSKISYRLGSELRFDVYHKVLKFSKNEYDKIGTSSLITRNTNDVTHVQTLVEMGLKFLIMSPIMLIGGIIMTYLLSPPLALIYLAVIPFLLIAYLIIFHFANPLYSKMQQALDCLNLYFREGLTGSKVIRAFDREESEYQKYKVVNGEYKNASVAAGTIMSFFIPVITLFLNLAGIVIMWIAGRGVQNGSIQMGSILGAISYGSQILMGFGMLTGIILAIPRGQISAKRINEILDMPLSMADGKETYLDETTLTFDDIDFRYYGAERKTLSGISFTVHTGQTLAVIGSTGDGKSSMVNLISRLYDVEKGQVRINGTDVRNLPQKAVHEKVSFSPQTSTLFFGTIRSNLLIAKPNATDEELWSALRIADAEEFINLLDKGIDSIVEKNGGNFSGGQKQRLCIARTLLKDADIYIFDDSFSALDLKTDAKVRNAMKTRLSNVITVIVAQRISTVRDADIIAVLDNGTLAGLGSHNELENTNEVYKEIIKSQEYQEVAA